MAQDYWRACTALEVLKIIVDIFCLDKRALAGGCDVGVLQHMHAEVNYCVVRKAKTANPQRCENRSYL